MSEKPAETVVVKCIECFVPMRVEKRFQNEANPCSDCVRKYREKHGTKSRVRKRKS